MPLCRPRPLRGVTRIIFAPLIGNVQHCLPNPHKPCQDNGLRRHSCVHSAGPGAFTALPWAHPELLLAATARPLALTECSLRPTQVASASPTLLLVRAQRTLAATGIALARTIPRTRRTGLCDAANPWLAAPPTTTPPPRPFAQTESHAAAVLVPALLIEPRVQRSVCFRRVGVLIAPFFGNSQRRSSRASPTGLPCKPLRSTTAPCARKTSSKRGKRDPQ